MSETIDSMLGFNLEQTLLSKGVMPQYISYMKNNNPKNLIDYYSYYDLYSERKELLVEPAKIIDIQRCDRNISFLDNAITNNTSNLDGYRMITALRYIRDDTLSKLYRFYEEELDNPVDLVYFSNEDIYRVGCDGNHRSLYAKIISAPYIKARVLYYKLDIYKYNLYLDYKKILSEYGISSLSERIQSNATFIYNGCQYTVSGYVSPMDTNLSRDSINLLKNQLNSDFKLLKSKAMNKYLFKYPQIRRYYFKYCNLHTRQVYRLSQHIDHRWKIDNG